MALLNARNLFFFSALLISAASTQAQKFHFSDIESLYAADSASFRNFCLTNGLDKESFHEYPQSYFLGFYPSDTSAKKVGLSRSFGKDSLAPEQTTYILNYFLGDDEEQYEQLKNEILKAGFKFKTNRTVHPPGNYSIEGDSYEKDLYIVELQKHTKDGKLFGYNLAFNGQLKK